MVDWARINGLLADLGEEGFDEVLALFLEEMEEISAGLGAGGGGLDALANDLHALRGAAANMGMVQLCALCAGAEKGARMGTSPDLAPIRDACKAAREQLLDGLAARAQIRNCASVSSLVMSR